MSVNFQQLAPIFAVCMGASSVLINYGSYSQTLKSLELKVEAQEKKVNSVDIITNELTHLQGSLDELKVNIKNEFAQILTCTEAVRPEKLTIWVIFYVESELQVENARFLHPDLENYEKRT